MRLSFREFHLQFDPTLRRERVPEAMFELLGPAPTARPVFEGPPETTAADPEAPVAMDAAQPQLNGSAAADAPAAGTGDAPAQAAAEASADAAAAAPAEPAAASQDQGDELEPVPSLAQELFTQVRPVLCNSRRSHTIVCLPPLATACHVLLLHTCVCTAACIESKLVYVAHQVDPWFETLQRSPCPKGLMLVTYVRG